jgi:mono/diheme cytochrome c family protein
VNGWYEQEQAAAGEKLFEASCSSCHGVKLEGGAGPALSGVTWKQRFGGAKLFDGVGRD